MDKAQMLATSTPSAFATHFYNTAYSVYGIPEARQLQSAYNLVRKQLHPKVL